MGHQLERRALERELAEVRRPLDDWRRRKGAPNPIPAPIWDDAVALAARHGVGPVAAGLKLDYAKLKAKLAAGGEGAATTTLQPASPTFVELFSGSTPAPKLPTVGPCVLRIRSPKGVRVRVDLASVGMPELATLLKELI